MKSSLDLNETVYFELSHYGIEVWEKSEEEMKDLLGKLYRAPKRPPTSMQLWRFMALFGPGLYVGGLTVVEDSRIWLTAPSPLEKLATAAGPPREESNDS